MDVLSHEQLCELMTDRTGPCVSIHIATPSRRDGCNHLKQAVRQAAARLGGRRLAADAAAELLRPADALRNDEAFWRHQSDGLSVFCAPGYFRAWRLPIALEESLTVGSQFHVLPLLPFVLGVDRFYLLALGHDAARLYHANERAICELRTGDFPMRMNLGGIPGERAETHKKDLLYRFQKIDAAARRALHDQRAPLVLACVGYLAALYETVNSYPYLAGGKVPGNPELWTEEELQSRAWRLLQPWFKRQRDEALAALSRAERHKLATHDLQEAARAAAEGRVETLFVATAREAGRDGDAAPRALASEDLLDRAAAQTLAHGGTVRPLRLPQPPGDFSPIAAILRAAPSTSAIG
jgi:hypothetical protein